MKYPRKNGTFGSYPDAWYLAKFSSEYEILHQRGGGTRAEGYLVKFSPCGLGAELIMQNSTDRNHWGGTIGRSS